MRLPTCWLVVAAAAAACVGRGRGIVLDGSEHSYAQYPRWQPGGNGSLQLEFLTVQPSALLLYTDDGRQADFFEVKLVEGSLRLRYNLGSGAQMIGLGRGLSDGRWHTVTVTRRHARTTLTVDHISDYKLSQHSREYDFGSAATNSHVFVGGLPYAYRVSQLALPSVGFEPRLAGEVRNLVYASLDGVERRQDMTAYKGVRWNGVDACAQHDPCQHGGICISTDTGAACECRNLDFRGAFCEKEKLPSEATLSGLEYMTYDITKTGGEAIASTSDNLSMFFKTRQPNGLLFYTGDGDDYMTLALKDGWISLAVSLGSGALRSQVRPARVRFDDDQWHKVTVNRVVKEVIGSGLSVCYVSINVDGVYTERGTTSGHFTLLTSSRLFVAGSGDTSLLPGSQAQHNFVGCLRKVEYTADSLHLDLIELSRTGNKLISVHGKMKYMCQTTGATDPISMTSRGSYLEDSKSDPISLLTSAANLALPSWNAHATGSISFRIRTNEEDGLILFNKGRDETDMFAVELLSGHVWVHLDLGSGAVKVRGSERRVDDGLWHEIGVIRDGRKGRVTVDGKTTDFVMPGSHKRLDLEGPLYVGGLGSRYDLIKVPAKVWCATRRIGYVGCIRDLDINGNVMNIARLARRQSTDGSVLTVCHTGPPSCESQPCMNGGQCADGWNRFICDCTMTSFSEPTCSEATTTVNFDGNQHMIVPLRREQHTEADDITLRFRTSQPSGLLFATTAGNSDRIELALMGGRLRLTLRISDTYKQIHASQSLNDNSWHRVAVKRRNRRIQITIDNERPLNENLETGVSPLRTKFLYIGAVSPTSGTSFGAPNLVGQLQHFLLNGQAVLALVRQGQLNDTQGPTHFGRRPATPRRKITFQSRYSFVALHQLRAYSSISIHFQFRTLESTGLLFYNDGSGQDFLAVELVGGHIRYVFNPGDGPFHVMDHHHSTLNDNQWHAVTIAQPNTRTITLMVDQHEATIKSLGRNDNLDLQGLLYVGGVPDELYGRLPSEVESRYGYKGCLASVLLGGGETPDLVRGAVIPSPTVVPGCIGFDIRCTADSCKNAGVCKQDWNSFTCDCTLTSFMGARCTEESASYQFGSGGGLIEYEYERERRPDRRSDQLAVGFSTNKSDGTILRIESETHDDYLELKLIESNVYLLYDVGSGVLTTSDLGARVDDGKYHVVRVIRNGPNSTLQLDSRPIQSNYPPGHHHDVFHSPYVVSVGGDGTARHRFEGLVSGLVVNGHRVLERAADNDPGVSMRGELSFHQLPSSLKQEYFRRSDMQSEAGLWGPSQGVDDDLIRSDAGSGCGETDDLEQCFPVFSSDTNDDLVTPVYIRPTNAPRPRQPSRAKSCDDEDCLTEPGFRPRARTTTTTARTTITTTMTTTTTRSTTRRTTARNSWRTPPPNGIAVSRATTPWPPTPEHAGGGSGGGGGGGGDGGWSSYHPPSPAPGPSAGPPRSTPNRSADDPGEYVAMIIGIIAGALIVVIVCILIVLKVQGRSERRFKADEAKAYLGQRRNSPTPPLLGGTTELSGAPVSFAPRPPKPKKSKDVKEWYV